MDVVTRPYVLDTGADALGYCKSTGKVSTNGVTIAYSVFEEGRLNDLNVGAGVEPPSTSGQADRVVMIMGFAAAGAAWLPTLKDLFSRRNKAAGIEVATFDNRGIGQSSCPTQKALYTTDIMAQDVLGLMDHLGWRTAHIVGHSMGGMIACRLALLAPDRVASLTLISVTCGGLEAVPTNFRALWTGLVGSSSKDPVRRAKADLVFHFSHKLLHQKDPVTGRRVKDELVDEYVAFSKEVGRQTKAAEEGHLNAVMKHGLTAAELKWLATAGFPIKVIHGADDILAAPRCASRLARRLHAPLVMLDGAHFIPRDCAAQVNDEILSTIEAVRLGATHVDAVHVCLDPQVYERGCLPCCA